MIVDVLGKTRQWDRMRVILDEARYKGRVRLSTVGKVMRRFFGVGLWEDAFRIFYELGGFGLEKNTRNMKLFVDRLCREDLGECARTLMAERQTVEQQQLQPQSLEIDDMMPCVSALEAALLPCLPARELQAIDRSPHPSHQIDVERHARDFMDAAKKLQLYFITLQREDPPTKVESLRKEVAMLEGELKKKTELVEKQERLIQEWRRTLKGHLDKLNSELERV